MSWVLDQERSMLRDSARSLLTQRAPVAHLRERRDRHDGGFSPEVWRSFGEQGYSAVLVAPEHGGMGLGVAEAALLAEQFGHTLTPSPFLGTAVLSAMLLSAGGSAAQQAYWLSRVTAAEVVLAPAIDEGGRHTCAAFQTRATRRDEGVRIDGAKTFVPDAQAADAFIVAAQGETGLRLVLVLAGTPGVRVEERSLLVDSQRVAHVHFDGVLVDAGCVLDATPAKPVLERALDGARVAAGAELLGIADEVFQRTLDYLRQRRQFGRLIGEFQALQHRAAELFCDLELSRALLCQAAAALDSHAAQASLLVAQAKARLGLTAMRAVQEGVQMHGGMGMTDELDFGLFMERARVLTEWLGSPTFHLDRAARMAGY